MQPPSKTGGSDEVRNVAKGQNEGLAPTPGGSPVLISVFHAAGRHHHSFSGLGHIKN